MLDFVGVGLLKTSWGQCVITIRGTFIYDFTPAQQKITVGNVAITRVKLPIVHT